VLCVCVCVCVSETDWDEWECVDVPGWQEGTGKTLGTCAGQVSAHTCTLAHGRIGGRCQQGDKPVCVLSHSALRVCVCVCVCAHVRASVLVATASMLPARLPRVRRPPAWPSSKLQLSESGLCSKRASRKQHSQKTPCRCKQ